MEGGRWKAHQGPRFKVQGARKRWGAQPCADDPPCALSLEPCAGRFAAGTPLPHPVRETLRRYFEDRRQGRFGLHTAVLGPPPG
jgi:hypothetical protein